MGKSSSVTVGYWYHPAFHMGLGYGPGDALLEIRGGDKPAWQGELTASGTITVSAPNLWGGEKDQGGMAGDMDIMFGEATQQPNAYLTATFGPQQPAWRGFMTVVWKGGRYGAMNPYPQKISYKWRKIKMGWDGDPGDGSACWYPEKAIIDHGVGSITDVPGYFVVAAGAKVNISFEGSEIIFGYVGASFVGTAEDIGAVAIGVRNSDTGSTYTPAGGYIFPTGTGTWSISGYSVEDGPLVGIASVPVTPICPTGYNANFVAHGPTSNGITNPTIDCTFASTLKGMNPAHILYYARTQQHMGREPVANINDASFRAAADWYYAQGFGLCANFDSSQESIDAFIQRIEKVAGCSTTRSPADGLWYLDVANGEYDIDSLPVLTDDDILSFTMQPATLDSAINSVSVQYFDPQQKTTVSTRPVEALALVSVYGRNHQDTSYPEIPTSALALRVSQRDLQSTATPTHGFEITATRVAHAWRKGTYFRLQAPKNGVADMVCIVGDPDGGTLASGAIKFTAVEDIYSLPSSSFAQQEGGVDTRPPTIPLPISAEVAFEAPYIVVARNLSRADLAALPNDVGYLMAVAQDPATSKDYEITVSVDGGVTYADRSNGQWCPTALIVEGDALDAGLKTSFTLSGAALLSSVVVGQAALWLNQDGTFELCRVDAIDAVAGTLTLGRGCADTVPAVHAANSRIWFFDGFAGMDTTEYTSGETISVKLLTNSWTQQIDPGLATPLPLTFAQRQYLPYPPGNLRFNGSAWAPVIAGALQVDWSTRNRVTQTDQLIDALQGDVAAEADTTYDLLLYDETDTLRRSVTGSPAQTYVWATEADDCQIPGQSSGVTPLSLVHFDGTDGSTVITDDVAARVWTASGAAKLVAAGAKFGSACASFNGSNSYITSGDAASFWKFLHACTTPWTIDGWVSPSGSGTRTILDNGGAASAAVGIYISVNGSNQLAVNIARGTSGTMAAQLAAGAVPNSTWTYIKVLVDPGASNGKGLKVYINGALAGESAISSPSSANPTSALTFGRYTSGIAFYYNGLLDEFRIRSGFADYDTTVPGAPFVLNSSTYRLNGRIRVQSRSERDGVASLQQHNVIVRRAGYGTNYGMFYGGHA